MPPPGGLTPDGWADKIAALVAERLKHRPPQLYTVVRMTPDGKTVSQEVSLAQLMAEHTDQLRIANQNSMALMAVQLKQHQIMAEHLKLLQISNRIGIKALRRRRRRKL